MGLELLAPARDADMGLLALRGGADAVYVGGPAFGARRGAGNPLSEVARLATEAHRLGARVHATLNTILLEDELEEARRLAWGLFEAGVDALIVQDMAFLEMDLPPLPLHASTQAACDGPARVAFLARAGFSRAILARELSLAEIQAIRRAAGPPFGLEAFVYGALCVGESGRCGLGQALQGRSGNRGQCPQPCRRGWDLLDGEGRVLVRDRPLLSIRDLDLTDHLEALARAGVSSFKIEGRMKDADYLRNAVGHARRRLDALLEAHPDLGRSSGTDLGFEPDPRRTFHRDPGPYRLDGARRPLLTGPASGWLGDPVGRVARLEGRTLWLDREAPLAPGDVLSWPGPSGRVGSTPVEEVRGPEVRVARIAGIVEGQVLHRTRDARWLEGLRQAVPMRRHRPDPVAEGPLPPDPRGPRPPEHLDARWNVSNSLARRFYARHGVRTFEPPLEREAPGPGQVLLDTRLCLAFEAGRCPRHPLPSPGLQLPAGTGPLRLATEGLTLRAEPDCAACRVAWRLEPPGPPPGDQASYQASQASQR